MIFTDFDSAYSNIKDLGKLYGQRTFSVQSVSSAETLIARMFELSTHQDRLTFDQVKSQVLGEVNKLTKLINSGIVANFRELCYRKNMFVIVTDCQDQNTVPFSEWFSNTWCPEHADRQDPAPALSLMSDLSNLVLSLHKAGLSHGNLVMEHILVQVAPPSFDSAVVSLVGGHGKTDFQSVRQTQRRGHSPLLTRQGHTNFFQKMFGSRKLSLQTNGMGPSIGQLRISSPKPKIFTLKLKGFSSQEIPDSRNASQPDAEGGLRADSRENASKHKMYQRNDIYSLGILFVYIIFGIDLHKALLQAYGHDFSIARSVEKGSTDVLLGLEPSFPFDPKIIVLLVQMLDKDPLVRPEAYKCSSILSQELLELSTKPARRRMPTAIRATIVSPNTMEGFWSGINSGYHQKDSFRVSSTILTGFELLGTARNNVSTDAQKIAKKHLKFEIPQERSSKHDHRENVYDRHSYRYSTGLMDIPSEDAAKTLNQTKNPPGELMRRLYLSSNERKPMMSRIRDPLSQTPVIASSRSSSVPRVCLNGRAYFSVDNKLKNVRIEEEQPILSVTSMQTPSPLGVKESRTMKPSLIATNRPLFIKHAECSEALKHRRLSVGTSQNRSLVPRLKLNSTGFAPSGPDTGGI